MVEEAEIWANFEATPKKIKLVMGRRPHTHI